MKAAAAMLVILAVSCGSGYALEGPGRMEFPTKKGTVVFDHTMHKKAVKGECTACHETPGEIKGFDKNVAHKLCIGCHQPPDEAPLGPITCEGCHGN